MAQRVERQVEEAIGQATSTLDLREIELKFLGKSGELTGLMRGIGKLSPEERPRFGAALNEAKDRLQALLVDRLGKEVQIEL